MTVAYRWETSLFCGVCMVKEILDYEPWSQWREVHILDVDSRDPEALLDSIAKFVGVDRDDPADIALKRFPYPLPGEPRPPTICRRCFRWFPPEMTFERQKEI